MSRRRLNRMHESMTPKESVHSQGENAEHVTWCPDDQFPLVVSWYNCNTDKVSRACYHREWEVQFIHRGHGGVFIHDRVYNFQKNTVLLVHPGEIHRDLFEHHSDFESSEVRFLVELLKTRPDACLALNNLSAHHIFELSEKDAVAIEFCLKEIITECRERDSHWQGIILNNLEKILILLERAADDEPIPQAIDCELSPEIIDYVEKNLFERITLQKVAKATGVSSFSLSKAFKRYMGLGFQEYVIQRRIAESRMMLETSDLKVAAVARKVGFADISTFYRNFRILTGFTPTDYRKSFRNAEIQED